jgi:hypothetical protein
LLVYFEVERKLPINLKETCAVMELAFFLVPFKTVGNPKPDVAPYIANISCTCRGPSIRLQLQNLNIL